MSVNVVRPPSARTMAVFLTALALAGGTAGLASAQSGGTPVRPAGDVPGASGHEPAAAIVRRSMPWLAVERQLPRILASSARIGATQDSSGATGRADPGLALAASAVLPGAGQFLLGNDRWVPYLALELWGWISFLNRRSDARALASDYRDLAWSVARRVSVGDRRDTIFEYYEEMTHFAASGTWDSDPETPGVQPELDPTTYNGDQWALARSLFFPGGGNYQPGTTPYERALSYYLSSAIPPTFTWAWGDSFLEQQSFRELIRRSDEAYRSASNMLGLILANHVVSAVDALVIGRLQSAPDESRRLRVGSGLERGAYGATRLRIQAVWRW